MTEREFRIKEIIDQLDIKFFSPKLKEAWGATAMQAYDLQRPFITPEMLFYNFLSQKELVNFLEKNNIDSQELRRRIEQYNCEDDKIYQVGSPSSEKLAYGKLTYDLKSLVARTTSRLLKSMKDSGIEIEGSACISVSDIVFFMIDEGSTYIGKILEQQLDPDPSQWMLSLFIPYIKDKSAFFEEKVMRPIIKAEAYINGKRVVVEGDSKDNLLDKILENARQILRKSNGVPPSKSDEPEEIDMQQAKSIQFPDNNEQEWTKWVTCLNESMAIHRPIIGREKELERAIRILCRKDKNNPLFIGEPGVGKTAIVYGITQMIMLGKVPQWMQSLRIYSLDTGSLVAGSSFHGELERRMKLVLEHARKDSNCILYIDEIHNLITTGGNNSAMNMAELMKPYLENGEVRFMGSTTYQDYNKTIAGRKAIARRFGLVDVKEPSVEETIRIIEGIKGVYEAYHGVRYQEDAIHYAVEKTHSLIHDRHLPDKAIEMIDEAGAYQRLHPRLNKKGMPMAARYQNVDKELMKKILCDICHIDAKALTSKKNDELKHLGAHISQQIYGQDEAVNQIVRSVMMAKAGLTDPEKPIASFLFVGPTGVGKTEVCKVLAEALGIELVRFDMSEYTEQHTISKLIGSPAGYVGYEEGGQLTDVIRRTPNCVLLLDEIEKAHASIYNILLQVMDYASLTDNKGEKASFKNVILVMTSNAGAQYAGQAAIGFAGGQNRGQAMLTAVKKVFKPEFINRLSGTVVFNEMNHHMASLILDKKLRQLNQRLEPKNVSFTLTDGAHALLLSKGYNQQYGAREMDRAIQQHLTPLLMDAILFGRLAKGGHATISNAEDSLTID